jgi:hypothetical protein
MRCRCTFPSRSQTPAFDDVAGPQHIIPGTARAKHRDTWRRIRRRYSERTGEFGVFDPDNYVLSNPWIVARYNRLLAAAKSSKTGWLASLRSAGFVPKGRAFAFGKAFLTRGAIQQANPAVLSEPAADRQVPRTVFPVIHARTILMTESRRRFHEYRPTKTRHPSITSTSERSWRSRRLDWSSIVQTRVFH